MDKLKRGNPAPDFKLLDQSGGVVSLSEFRGRKVLIYFYPRANTPGCTKQSCTVRDALEDLKNLGVSPLGISPDPPARQKKFDEKHSLGFPLLADTDCAVAEAYGVRRMKALFGKTALGIVRSAFLVDAEGLLQEVWYKVSPADTVPNVKQALT